MSFETCSEKAEQMGYGTDGVTFNVLRGANKRRQQEWPGNEHADTAFRAIELAGEAGEVAEAVKKFLRAERGIKGSTATKEDIALEMGDMLVSLDLLAESLGINLGEAVRRKFNATSEKYGMRTYIGSDGDWHLHPETISA
jgi:NTP pyrophosphatase (non-canonical NTP hydrolase)